MSTRTTNFVKSKGENLHKTKNVHVHYNSVISKRQNLHQTQKCKRELQIPLKVKAKTCIKRKMSTYTTIPL
jgi:hypothetical protein